MDAKLAELIKRANFNIQPQCDTDCQQRKREQELFFEYQKALNNVREAPQIADQAEEKYYIYSGKSSEYERKKEDESKIEAAKKAGVKRVVLTSSTAAMQGGKTGTIKIDESSWTNVDAKNVTAYFKSKTLAEKSAWDFIKNQTDDSKLELVVINPGPIYGPTLTGNLSNEAMDFFKKLITGKVPMLPRAYSVMSDVRDVAAIHVASLENEKAIGNRFIVTTEKVHSIQEIAQILKSNGYEKVSTKLAPTFLLKFMAKFNDEAKGMLPFIGNTVQADVRNTMSTFNWKPISFDKTVLDAAKSVKSLIDQ